MLTSLSHSLPLPMWALCSRSLSMSFCCFSSLPLADFFFIFIFSSLAWQQFVDNGVHRCNFTIYSLCAAFSVPSDSIERPSTTKSKQNQNTRFTLNRFGVRLTLKIKTAKTEIVHLFCPIYSKRTSTFATSDISKLFDVICVCDFCFYSYQFESNWARSQMRIELRLFFVPSTPIFRCLDFDFETI